MNESNINYDALINKGILTSKNEISQDKINFIIASCNSIQPVAILDASRICLKKHGRQSRNISIA